MRSKADYVVFSIKGSSMSPLLLKGDMVKIFKSKKRAYFGQVILFTSSYGFRVIHRAITIFGKTLTMGDRNNYVDAYENINVIGVADVQESFFKRVYYALRILRFYLFKSN